MTEVVSVTKSYLFEQQHTPTKVQYNDKEITSGEVTKTTVHQTCSDAHVKPAPNLISVWASVYVL